MSSAADPGCFDAQQGSILGSSQSHFSHSQLSISISFSVLILLALHSLYRFNSRHPPTVHRRTPLAAQQGCRNHRGTVPRPRTSCTAHTLPITSGLQPQGFRLKRSCHCSYTLERSGESSMHFQKLPSPHRTTTMTPNQSAFGVECISLTALDHLSTSLSPYFHSQGFQPRRLVELL